MPRRRSRPSDAADVDMTPMLDIVFIMLIFFIVTAVFLDETGMDFTEPPENDAPSTLPPALLVSLDAEDRVVIDGRRVALSRVAPSVEALRATAPNRTVVLSADAQASVAAVVRIKDDLDRADVPLSLRVEPGAAR